MFKGIVKRPIAVTMVLIAVMVLGITAIKKLPVSLVPDIDIPQITVQVTSPDRSARELNDALLQPLRSELAQVPHLKDIICTAKDGNGLIEMTFEYGTDADYTFIDVNERVDLASARWDASEDRPIIARDYTTPGAAASGGYGRYVGHNLSAAPYHPRYGEAPSHRH